MDVVHKISVDFGKEQIPQRISVMQNDSARKIEVSLYENGAVWNVPDETSAYLAFRRPDGKNIKSISLGDGSPVVAFNENVATIQIPPELTFIDGDVPAVVVFVDANEKQIATFPTWVQVRESPSAESADDETIAPDQLTQILSAIASLRATVVQQSPLFANSIEECTDTSKLYVLPDGYIYAYMTTQGRMFTDQLANAIDSDGTPYNGGLGFKDGYRLGIMNSENATPDETPEVGSMMSGFIPYNLETIRICGYPQTYTNQHSIYFYDANFQRIICRPTIKELVESRGQTFGAEPGFDGNAYTFTFDLNAFINKSAYYGGIIKNSAKYFRFAIPSVDKEHLLCTLNEEIAFGTSTQWSNTGHAFVPADYEDRIIPLEEKAENHDSRIRTLEMYGSNSISDANIPAYIKAEADAVIEKVINKQGNRSFTMVGISDFHYGGMGDNKDNLIRASKAISYIQGRIHVDAVATLGDNLPYGSAYDESMRKNADRWSQEINEILAMTQKPGIVDFRTPGNHDRFGTTESYMPDNAIYSFISGYNRQCDYVDVPGGWAYRDFNGHNLRVIVLNTAETEGKGRFSLYSGYHMSTKQYKWLIDTLDMSDKPNASDWKILILSHHRPDDWQEYIAESSFGKNGYILPNILNAYIIGGRFTGTLSDGSGVSCDFTGKNLARIIGCIHGHHHNYKYGNLYLGESSISDPCDIMAIGTPTSSFGTSGTQNNDNDGNYYDNVKDTAQETAFCVYSIDLDNHVIHAVHYGAGIDRTINC